MANESLIRCAVYERLREEGYTRVTLAIPLYLKAFRKDGSLRVYHAMKGQHRHYFLEVRRTYRGISAKIQAARRTLQQSVNRIVLLLEVRAGRAGQLEIIIHE